MYASCLVFLEGTVFCVPTFFRVDGKNLDHVMILDAHSSEKGEGENSIAVNPLCAEFF